MFSSFELKDDKISNQRKKIFINKNNIEIKSISKKIKSKLEYIEEKHTENSNLLFLKNKK